MIIRIISKKRERVFMKEGTRNILIQRIATKMMTQFHWQAQIQAIVQALIDMGRRISRVPVRWVLLL